MHTYPLSVDWNGTTAERAFTRDHVALAPGKREIPMSAGDPTAGDPTRWNPEDMLGASLAACHMLTFLALAAKVGLDVRHYQGRAEATLDTVDKVTRVTRISLTPLITLAPGADIDKARLMFDKAHRYCFIANSITAEVTMEPSFVVDHGAT